MVNRPIRFVLAHGRGKRLATREIEHWHPEVVGTASRRRSHRPTEIVRFVSAIAARRWPGMLLIALLTLSLALVFVKAVEIAHYEVAILRHPFQIDDAEGVILAEATLIAHGTNPYIPQPSPAHFFYAGPYTPLYTMINAAIVGIVGPTFVGGRVVQLLATLAVAAWIAWAVSRSGRGRLGWIIGAWAALLLLTWHLVAHWSVMVRPDMTALVWNLAGVTLLRRWWDAPGREGWRTASWPQGRTLGVLALGAGCFALAWWTKQTFIVVPLAFVLALLPYRPKVAVTLAGLYAATVMLSLGILTFVTAGGFFQKTYYYQFSWTWHAYLFLARPFAQRYGLLLALAFLAAIFMCVRQRRLTLTACWFALTLLKTLAAGTDGGNHNHFLEVLVTATLLVGQAVTILLSSARRPDRIRALPARSSVAIALAGLVVILVLTGVAVGEQEGPRGWLAREVRAPTAAERQDFERVASYVARTAGPIYGDNVGLGILAVTGHDVSVTDPFTMAAEVRMGRWDDSAIIANVVAGRYRLIVLRGDVAKMDPSHPPGDETPGLIRAIQRHYHVVERNALWLYAPNA